MDTADITLRTALHAERRAALSELRECDRELRLTATSARYANDAVRAIAIRRAVAAHVRQAVAASRLAMVSSELGGFYHG
ncbi:hypothetical protein [Agrobacterium tumefaciens]|uniref:hypothetical protein n=1 Tax=Agrobacterium tumefaciens TaxID=358 RepID=UPI001AE98564|nr:hypothetical protein [Agrobacterium tumefaciens]MBP2535225.1 hypothetical protein [Agrobacterium tumefaciens]